MNDDKILNRGALELAIKLHNADINGIEEISVDGTSILCTPTKEFDEATVSNAVSNEYHDQIVADIESVLDENDEYPFTFSEEWFDGDEYHMLVEAYWPIGCDKAELQVYDDFVLGREEAK